jgi:hypothetical protein
MIKRVLFIFLILSNFNLTSQNLKDSIKTKGSWYGRITPCSLYAGYGSMNNRINQNMEFGRSIGVIDIGLAATVIEATVIAAHFAQIQIQLCTYLINLLQ